MSTQAALPVEGSVHEGVAVEASPPTPALGGTDGAAPPEEHAQAHERLAGYYIGALTSNLICLGDK